MPLNSWRQWLNRTFGRTRTAPIRRSIPLRLEGLEDRITPSSNLQTGGVVHLPFTTTEVEGTTGNNSAQVFTGNTQASPTLLDFTDPTGTTADYSVTITWGDGSVSSFLSTNANAPAVVTTTGGGSFHVVPTSTAANAHVYDEAADGNIFTVDVRDVGSGADTGPVSTPFTSSVNVSDAPLRVDAGPGFTANEGATTGPVVLATFTDANPGNHTADFSTAINWGDGTTIDASSGAISYDSGTGVYTVTGSHSYAEEGSYFASVRITDVGGFAVDTGVGLNGSGAVVTAASQTAGAWYPDRFPPNGFVGGQTDFGRTGVIDETISAADADGSRPPAFNSGFYDYQGRKYDLPPGSTYVTMDLYVPSSYATLDQQDPSGNPANFGSVASLWGTGVDNSNASTSFPIIGFNNLGTNNGNTGSAGFEVFDQTNGWTVVPGFTGYDQWYQLSIGVSGGNLVYFVNGAQVYTDTTVTGTTAISNEILQGYNGAAATAQTYDIFWNPVQDTPATVADQQIQNLSLAAPGFTPAEGGSIGGPFTGVATFTDPAGQGVETAADFSATINWGDGATDAATVVSDGSGNYHVNIPDHTYADEGAYNLSVTVTHDLLPPVTSNTQVLSVNEADTLTPTATTITPTEGTAFSGTVATFTDSNASNVAADFSATIDWGDGTTIAGTVSGGAGSFTVSGGHTYADEGNFTATVVLSDDAPGTASATATSTVAVADADSLGAVSFPSFTATEGVLFSGTVGVFSDAGYPTNSPSDFTASIDWGDGATTAGTVSSAGDGNFTVSGAHTYADEGSPTVFVSLVDDAPGTANLTLGNAATVTEADTLTGTGSSFTALESPNSFSGNVATFTDTNTSAPASDFTASINWGDGTVTAGTVSGGTGGPFSVSGTHTYAEDGSYSPVVTLSDDAPGSASATATGSATVQESSLGITAVGTITTTEGQTFSGTVATASDPGSPDPGSSFTATIDWGDGTTDTGTVGGSAGAYTISGSHSYTDEGNFTATVTFFENNDPTFTVSDTDPVNVSEGDVLGLVSFPSFTATEGALFSGTVGVFSDAGYPTNSPSDFTASIDWGDGATTAGTVSSAGDGNFTVSGTHTYADEGSFAATVVLTDDAPGTDSATAASTVTVSEADVLTLNPAQPSLTATEGQSFSGRVANFVNTNAANNTPADFTATIDWGDGTTTAGTVSNPGGNIYGVDGTHTYADEGNFTATVVLSDDAPGTASATASNAIAVAEADVLTVDPAQPSLTATEGQSFSGRMANFVNTNAANNTPADFTATIDWGDGTTTAGTVSNPALTNIYAVDGSHTYADEGNFTATVILSDDAPGTASATASNAIAVAEGDVLTGTPAAVSATEGTAVSGAVAIFSDTDTSNVAADFTATINWGDGTTTAGTVTGGAGSLTVSGSHAYADEGNFTATVVLSDDAPGTAGATASNAIAVAEGDVLTGTLAPVNATEGTAFSGAVATFSDTDTSNVAADFTATINWGDGTTTAGTVTGGAGSFTVSGSHTYADEGNFTATVVLSDDAPGTAGATASNAIAVAEGDVLTGTAAPVSATEGTAFSGAVATFSDTNTSNVAADFTATINWGDGTTTAGTVTGGAGSFTVSGSHTYADEGNFTADVVLTENAPGTAAATASGFVGVADADVLSGSAAPIQTTKGTAVTGTIATFTDSYTGNTAADFTATINWGDGTTTVGTVTGGSGAFTVSGSHTYTVSGSFPVVVTLADDAPGAASQTATTIASVGIAPPPSVSEAFGPAGEVIELVDSEGVLFQIDATGTHVLGGGVRYASIAFGPGGEVLEVVSLSNVLTQFDASGAHQLGGAGVLSASVAFGPGGEVLDVVLIDGSVRQFSSAGVQVLGTGGVVSASVAFGPSGEVVEILTNAGALTQFTEAGAQQLEGGGVQSAGVAFFGNSGVLDIIFSDGTLDQFDIFGVHRLGIVP